MKQKQMFTTEDLPLFSGTPIKAKAKPFIPKAATTQLSFGKCRFCFGTGMVKGKFCGSCDAGHALRRKA